MPSASREDSPPGPLAVVYRGPASCPGCSEAVAALLRRSPLNLAVSYIGPGEQHDVTADALRGVAVYAQPGGDGTVEQAMAALGPAAAHAIRDYVSAGGRYLGFCMGAYLAGSDPGMAMLAPGDTGEYHQTPGALVKTAAETVIPVRWAGSTRYQYVQDAAYIKPSRVAGEKILSRFTNGRVNALVRPYAQGAVGVVGSHPEADRSWYTDRLWNLDHDGLDHEQGLQLLDAVLNA